MIDSRGHAEGARVQLPHGRPGDAADHGAPQVRPRRAARLHAIDGTLDKAEAEWDRRTALGVVLAAAGYPGRAAPGRRDRRARPRARRQTHPDVRRVPCGHHASRRQDRRRERRPRAVRDRARRFGAPGAARGVRGRRRDPLRRHAVPQRHRSSRAWRARPDSATSTTVIGTRDSRVDPAPFRAWLLDLQARIVAGLEAIDGGSVPPRRVDAPRRRRRHRRASSKSGQVLERGGVLFSHVTRRPAAAVGHRAAARARGPRVGGDWACRSCSIRAIRTRPPCT